MRTKVNLLLITVLLLTLVPSAATLAQGGGESYTVGIVRWSPDDIYFNGVQLGQELERQRLEEEEGVSIEFVVFGANDVSEQLTALQAQLARGVDGVMIVPWRGESMSAILQEIRDMGIPVIVSNALVPQAPEVFVAFDNVEAGRLAGEAIVNRLNELRGPEWVDGEGVIIELRCIITASFDIGRHTGYRSVLDPIVEANPNIVIEEREAGCDGAAARRATDDIISRYGPESILAVASIDGTMGIGGAVPAFASQGILFPPDDPRHIPVTTVDGSSPELEAIARGDIDHASVQPAIGEGTMAMRLLYQMMSTGEMIANPEEASVLYEDGEELWMPVNVLPSEDFDGPWYKTTAFSVPADVCIDDPRLWANAMDFQDTGEYTAYEGEYGRCEDAETGS